MKPLSSNFTRRSLIATAAAIGSTRLAFAQDEASTPESTPSQPPIESTTTGEMPSSGALRPGPVGENSPLARAANPTDPVNIIVEKAGINAIVEHQDIVDGVMVNPSGPWVVAWYRQTATLGEQGNVVLAGHVDFWNVGPSVFFNLRDLAQGDEIILTGEDDSTYTYAVDWVETFLMEDLTTGGVLEDVTGHTNTRSVTMITCGGEFDYVNGEYLSRMVVRGTFVPPPPATPESTPDA